jgi:hypothetical protein
MNQRRTQHGGPGFWLACVYSVLVAGFAAWCGGELWTWKNVSVVVLPPLVLAVLLAVQWWRQNPALPAVAIPLVGGVLLGGLGLLLAAVVAAVAKQWSWPAGRAAAAAGVTALGYFLMWAFSEPPAQEPRPPEADESQRPEGSEQTDG